MSPRGWRSAVVVAAVVSGALVACSLLVAVNDEQCATTGDCTTRGAAFTNAVCNTQSHLCVLGTGHEDAAVDAGATDPWYCLKLPPPVGNPNNKVLLSPEIFNPIAGITTEGADGGDLITTSYTGIPGITLEACDALETLCATPASGPGLDAGPVVTNSVGQATMVVSESFVGYVQYTGSGYVPSTLYMGPLLPNESTFSPPVEMLSTSLVKLLAGQVDVPVNIDPDGGDGLAFFLAYDCFDRHASGVTFSLSINPGPSAVTWYAQGGGSAPVTTVNETDQNGTAGVVNFAPGYVTVTASFANNGQVIGKNTAFIQAGWATTIWIRARTLGEP